MSEAVMMGLGRHIGREHAHDLVYDLCREALERNVPLIELLAAHPEIRPHVGRAELERWLDPINGTGQAGVMVDRVLARMR
jgi:3-carboxy-cis,cis-muconate cycloisomerase